MTTWLLFGVVVYALVAILGDVISTTITCNCGRQVARKVLVTNASDHANFAAALTAHCPVCQSRPPSPKECAHAHH